VAGIDEAGRGPLAGPVVAAAVVLGMARIPGIRDSKTLTALARERLYALIVDQAEAWSVALADAGEIDRINIYQATRLAMTRAVAGLQTPPASLLIDAMAIDWPLPQQALIHGESHSVSIAAASIIAKVTRDRIMQAAHLEFPQYGFDRHKGYGTAAHLAALREHGPCPLHRRSFAPLKAVE
jgi:ribonuclease HII